MQLSYGSTCEESYHVYPINRALQDLIGIRENYTVICKRI